VIFEPTYRLARLKAFEPLASKDKLVSRIDYLRAKRVQAVANSL
jgi:hypothetical protein